ncbi:unnamed protein product [Caenorhabditis auriculariae]|uniref:Uncharacterized protein n=1 Tax=Caenorhabditis auriculariae TaxID=2777116 RepID=A0A8S1HHV3_9PELO|nr:unnamed protein product [Caenorhabditis auriculariae]
MDCSSRAFIYESNRAWSTIWEEESDVFASGKRAQDALARGDRAPTQRLGTLTQRRGRMLRWLWSAQDGVHGASTRECATQGESKHADYMVLGPGVPPHDHSLDISSARPEGVGLFHSTEANDVNGPLVDDPTSYQMEAHAKQERTRRGVVGHASASTVVVSSPSILIFLLLVAPSFGKVAPTGHFSVAHTNLRTARFFC